ncbi:MAG: glycoside hydrolase family 44 protein [Deltaproteobacteria bacterium]|nr:glycoside hydrolase family 44 protein [Deltaproteobacteria bacterium]
MRLALLLLLCAAPVRADVVVYADALASGWQDWSWGGVTRDFARAAPVHGGTASVGVIYTGGWSGLQLGRNDAVDITGLDTLRCWIHGGSAGGQAVQVIVGNHLTGAEVTKDVVPAANAWTQVDVSLTALGTTLVTKIAWFNNSAGAQATFSVDDVRFVASGLPTPTPVGPVAGPALQVNAAAGRHAISPFIYGMNFADETLAAELRVPLRRWGGNATTRYNWRTDTSNRAADWYFENIPNDNANPGALPDGSSSDQFVESNLGIGADTLLTIPLIGWTPRGRAYGCGFSVAKYGTQQSVDPWRPDCGNGVRGNGSAITGNDASDISDAIAPSFVQEWMQHLIGRYGTAAQGGVRFYNLDNEPMLWSHTHRDVHPAPLSYDELRDRTVAYAAAIKATDPSAATLGPAEWGWTNYLYSALDAAPGGAWWNNPQDRLAHGNVELTAWYLQQLRAYDQQHGVRLLDSLDLHYYPQASGVSLAGAGDAATQARRLRSTRALWDANYTDESWINEPVRLLPRMRDWVNANYPGTKLAIGEYNWGAPEHVNGALAQADVLGIFGREGLDLATLWDPPTATQPLAFAFRMYRNYDGAGGSFGDTGVAASSADQATLAVYAAERGADGALTIIAINKTATPQTSALQLAGFTPGGAARVYRYGAANPAAIERLADVAMPAAGTSLTFAANAITLLVVPGSAVAGTPTPTPTPSPVPPSATRTATPSATRSASPTPTATRSPSATPSVTTSPTRTGSATATRSASATATPAATVSVSGALRYYRGAAPVPSVAVGARLTDASGAYTVAAVAGAPLAIAPQRTGGQGAALSSLDAAWILQAIAGTRTLDGDQRLAGDVTGDGTLSTLDAATILSHVVGSVQRLPAAERCGSEWLFVPSPSAAPNQSLTAPALASATCTMGAIAYTPLSAAANGQDFRAVLLGDVTGNWSP